MTDPKYAEICTKYTAFKAKIQYEANYSVMNRIFSYKWINIIFLFNESFSITRATTTSVMIPFLYILHA